MPWIAFPVADHTSSVAIDVRPRVVIWSPAGRGGYVSRDSHFRASYCRVNVCVTTSREPPVVNRSALAREYYTVPTWLAGDVWRTNGCTGSRNSRRVSGRYDGIFMTECVKNIIVSWRRQFPRKWLAHSKCIGQCLRLYVCALYVVYALIKYLENVTSLVQYRKKKKKKLVQIVLCDAFPARSNFKAERSDTGMLSSISCIFHQISTYINRTTESNLSILLHNIANIVLPRKIQMRIIYC